jgi:ketosteroid isomerase-like protein
VSFVSPDVLAYDLAPPLRHRGADVYRRGLQEWFPTFEGPVGYEVHDLNVETAGDLAVATSLDRITDARTNGQKTDVWVRATVVYRKAGGRWVITHEHRSVPFYMDGSVKAAVDLKP